MRSRVAALATAVLTTAGFMAAFTPGPASAQSPFPGGAAFSGYATGTALHVDAVSFPPNAPRLADGEVASSGEATNSANLATAINNEMAQQVSPALAAKNSYSRGSGLEVGLGTTLPNNPNVNQLILAGLAQQSAAPLDSFGDKPDANGIVTKEVGPVPADPLVYASLLRGQAASRWNPNACILGAPLGYGLGFAADAQLLDASTKNADGSMSQPIVAADIGTPTDRTVSQSKSYTYLSANGDGTFGVTSEVHETLAPITLFKGMASAEFRIEVAGEWVLKATATGKTGKVTYAPAGNPSPTTPLITITPPGGAPQIILKTQDLFGAGKFPQHIDLQQLGQINIGEDPRAIGSDQNPNPPGPKETATEASGAVDVVRITLLKPATDQHLADIRVGHMETKAVAPPGGIDCPIPVSKTANPNPATAGQDVTWTISIPTDATSLVGNDCDLTNIAATDTAKVLSGSPSATISSADHGGAIGANTVGAGKQASITWGNLGNYHPGDPPIVLKIVAHIPATSGAGVIQNTVNVTATLGNCKGGAVGQALIGQAAVQGTAAIQGAAVKGTSFVNSETKAAAVQARLAETGQRQPWLPVVGGGLLLGALALMRSRRRLHADRA